MKRSKGLEFVNRMQIAGFKKYFNERPEHFRDIYHREFTEEAARIAHKESMNLVRKCLRGESGAIL